jgi:biopolymer transport protein ExbB
MYLLLGMSVLTLAIVVYKLVQFVRMDMRGQAFVDGVMASLGEGHVEESLQTLAAHRSPVARVMEVSIRVGMDGDMLPADAEAEIGRVGSRYVRDMESWLRALSAIGHLAPFLGLLGTVVGMIAAFMDLQTAGSRVDPAVLSGGIWVALLTTAFGLAIAIPAMASYFYFEGEVDRVRAAMKDAGVQVLVHFRKGALVGTLNTRTLESPERHVDGGENYGV